VRLPWEARSVFSRVAIVNRGEAAMRLIHAVRELAAETGTRIETVAFYTDADRAATFVRAADLGCYLGPAAARRSPNCARGSG
jgi:acetyl/propionyl-CoA carboxylase alpha subunit